MADAAIPQNPRRKWRKPLMILGPLACAIIGLTVWLSGGRMVVVDNATVAADIATVSPQISGQVIEILVKNNQAVKRGDPLFKLDPEPYTIALREAEAALADTRDQLLADQAAYRQKQFDIAAADADIAFYSSQNNRQETLRDRRVVAQSLLDDSVRNLRLAKEKRSGLQQELVALAARLNNLTSGVIDSHPMIKAANARLDAARRNLRLTTITAPIDGTVAHVDALQPGERLNAGEAAFSLVDAAHPRILANPKETDLAHVMPGQPVRITIDTYRGVEWRGHVDSISPASNAEFSLLPAQNASGNWVKVVQRIPLTVALDSTAGLPPLRAGMSAEIHIDTGHERHLSDLLGNGQAAAATP